VNKASRVSSTAKGGQILVSGEVWSILSAKRGLLPPIDVRDLGMHALKGIAAETQLVEIMPAALAARGAGFAA
jgi:class 3 adenylate cyclase